VNQVAQAVENVRIPPRVVWKYLVQITIVFVAYFAAGKLGQATANIRSSNLGPVWPAYGIALAALLLYGYRVWVGIAAAAFLVAFLSAVPHVAAVGQAAGATLAALIGAFLLRRIAKFDSSLSRLRDALALILLGALGSAMVSASIGVSTLYAAHVRAYTGIGSAWLIYWLGDSTGVLLVTPLVLTAPNLLRIRTRVRIAEFAALLLLLTLVCIIVVGDLPLIPVKLHFLAFAVLPFVIWAAIRFGVSGAAMSTLIVSAIATVATAFGFGPFAQNTSFTNAVLLDVFFAVLSVSGLTLAAVIAEREKAESERERLVREQAAMEVRLRLATIVESSDDAIISKDLEGVIVSWNRGAQRIFGFTEAEAVGQPITIIIPPELQEEENKILQRLRAGESIEQYETLRVTKEGKKVDVSLMICPLKDSTGRIIGASKIARDITERKQTQDNLRESEERLRLAVETGRMYAFEWDPATDLIERSGECSDIFSWIDDSAHDTGRQFAARVHPDDRERYVATTETGLTAASPTYQTSYRVLRPDGSVTWLEESGRAFFDAQGKMLRAIGIGVDVSDRKHAEEAILGIGRKLIEAHEQERTRIGRDLHDDIVQRLVLLAIELGGVQQDVPESASELRTRIGTLQNEATQITNDVQLLSHELHSSKLDYLGIVGATKNFCKEFGERQKVEIDFQSHDLPTGLPRELSLSLFRVLQEALRNATKHSGIKRFEVRLWGSTGEIHLNVSDLGAGFDTETAMKSTGLGLTSMQERVRLVGGELSINSQPKGGTTIHARVPFNSISDSARAVG
jgi:PAS domain S-box-containing protein